MLKLARTTREGTEFTSSAVIPSDHAGTITVSLDINLTDLVNPSLKCKFSIFVLDQEAGWQPVIAGNWEGAVDNDAQPSITFNSEAVRGKEIRVELSMPKRMRVGCEATW